MTGVRFKQCHHLLFLAFNDLDDLEGILELLSCHLVVVVDACPSCSQIGEESLATADVDRSANVKRVGVLNGTNQFVNADRLDLFGILFTVSVSWFDDNLGLFVDLGIGQRSLKAGNEVSSTNDTHHWGVVSTLLVHFVFLRHRLTGGLNQVTAFAIVQFIINVDNCSFFHSLASKGMIRRPAPPS